MGAEYEAIVVNWEKLREPCVLGFFSVSLCLWREGCAFPLGTGRASIFMKFYSLY